VSIKKKKEVSTGMYPLDLVVTKGANRDAQGEAQENSKSQNFSRGGGWLNGVFKKLGRGVSDRSSSPTLERSFL